MKRMATYANTAHRAAAGATGRARPMRDFGPDSDKQAAYLAPQSELGRMVVCLEDAARVKGKGTRVVITSTICAPALMPHDVIVDREGVVWLSQFDEHSRRFDPGR